MFVKAQFCLSLTLMFFLFIHGYLRLLTIQNGGLSCIQTHIGNRFLAKFLKIILILLLVKLLQPDLFQVEVSVEEFVNLLCVSFAWAYV